MARTTARSAAAAKVLASLGSLKLETSIFASCSPEAAWGVITDYDRLGTFMPNLESRSAGRTARGELVRQTGISSLSKKVRFQFVLELVREDPQTLRFRQVLGNLRRYEGFWRVTPEPGGVQIAYRSSVVHGFPLSGRFLASLVETDVALIMPAIVAEIERRARHPAERGSRRFAGL